MIFSTRVGLKDCSNPQNSIYSFSSNLCGKKYDYINVSEGPYEINIKKCTINLHLSVQPVWKKCTVNLHHSVQPVWNKMFQFKAKSLINQDLRELFKHRINRKKWCISLIFGAFSRPTRSTKKNKSFFQTLVAHDLRGLFFWCIFS